MNFSNFCVDMSYSRIIVQLMKRKSGCEGGNEIPQEHIAVLVVAIIRKIEAVSLPEKRSAYLASITDERQRQVIEALPIPREEHITDDERVLLENVLVCLREFKSLTQDKTGWLLRVLLDMDRALIYAPSPRRCVYGLPLVLESGN